MLLDDFQNSMTEDGHPATQLDILSSFLTADNTSVITSLLNSNDVDGISVNKLAE